MDVSGLDDDEMQQNLKLWAPRVEKTLLGNTAVITGSASGIGRAIALQLAAAGADCLIHTRKNETAARQVVGQIRQMGRQAELKLADLSQAQACSQLAEDAWAWHGGVDLWVNNAGADVLTGEAAQGSFDEKLDQLWRVDVRATIGLSRDVGERMKTRGSGVIITIGWDRARCGMAGESGEMFAAVKGAVMAFTKSLARSLAPQVRVNCIAPGWIKTAWGENASDDWQQRAGDESLLRRWGTADDVAAVTRFLASPEAAFINGQVIEVNGGMKM